MSLECTIHDGRFRMLTWVLFQRLTILVQLASTGTVLWCKHWHSPLSIMMSLHWIVQLIECFICYQKKIYRTDLSPDIKVWFWIFAAFVYVLKHCVLLSKRSCGWTSSETLIKPWRKEIHDQTDVTENSHGYTFLLYCLEYTQGFAGDCFNK